MTKWCAVLGLALLTSGCLSTASVYSTPAKARVTMDERKIVGETPLQVEEQVYLWTAHTLTIEKDGYKPQVVRLEGKTYNLRSALLCICSLTALWPLAMTTEYVTNEVNVDLVPEDTVTSQMLTPNANIEFSGLSQNP